MPKLSMTDLGRLMHARPGLQPHFAMRFVFEFDPALEYIHKLKVRLVEVSLAGKAASGRTNDVGDNAALGCLLDPQISILEEGPQAALKTCLAGVRYNETSCRHGCASVKCAARASCRGIRLESPSRCSGQGLPQHVGRNEGLGITAQFGAIPLTPQARAA